MSEKLISTVGRSDGIYEKSIRIVSKDKVALRALSIRTERIVGGIFIREEADKNCRLNKYEITSIGSKAKEETGLDVGDIVCADALARYYDTYPMSVIKYDSIVFRTDKDDNEIHPLNNMCFVTPDKPIEENRKGIVVLTDLLPVGTITKINITNDKKCNLKVGDKVLLTTKMDKITYKGDTFYIYKNENVDAIIEEE